jgi:histidinol phosphatase-like enzyme (inositol monophosphatase family)
MSQRSEEALAVRLDLAVSAAHAAGDVTLQFFQRDEVQVERKSDNSPVTQADRQAEQLLRRRILESFPQDAIIGEEFGEVEGSSGYTWILDPIDGTKSFISGVPLYSVLIGIVSGGESLAGVILVPALQECVYAARGKGAWWVQRGGEPRPARVSAATSLSEGLFVTSQVDSFEKRGAAVAYHQLERAASITRSWGDGYGYLLVATGRALAMVDPIMNLWDAASLQPILREAGGSFTDWAGRDTVYGGEGIGTNGRVLAEVLAITRPFVRSAS